MAKRKVKRAKPHAARANHSKSKSRSRSRSARVKAAEAEPAQLPVGPTIVRIPPPPASARAQDAPEAGPPVLLDTAPDATPALATPHPPTSNPVVLTPAVARISAPGMSSRQSIAPTAAPLRRPMARGPATGAPAPPVAWPKEPEPSPDVLVGAQAGDASRSGLPFSADLTTQTGPIASPKKPRPGLELGTVIALAVGGLLTLAGGLTRLAFTEGDAARGAIVVLVLGMTSLAIAVALGHPLDRLHRILRKGADTAYDDSRIAGQLKAFALTLQILGSVAIAVAALGLVTRLAAAASATLLNVERIAALLLLAAIGVAQAGTHIVSLRRPRPDLGGETRSLVTGLALTVMAGLTILGLTLGLGKAAAGATFSSEDAPIILLAAAAAGIVGLRSSRNLPSLATMLGSDRALAGAALVGEKGVFLPILAGFALLLVVFFLFVLFGLGVVGDLSKAAQNPLIVASFVFLVLAAAGSVWAALRLAHGEPGEKKLYQEKPDSKKRREQIIAGASVAGAALFLIPAFILFSGTSLLGLPSRAWIHLFCIGLLVGLGPYGFYISREMRRIRQVEERFPDFLRDIASSHKGGLTLASALQVAARGDYGPLTPEVQRMAGQVSWNVSFQEVLQRFSERAQTPLVQRAVALIREADRSGGATTEVLLAAARDAREIKTLENERKLAMSLYTVVIYVTFFVFLGIAAVLYGQFVPQLVASQEALAAEGSTVGKALGTSGGSTLRVEDFQLFYLLAAVMQGLGDGIVAGMMGRGKAALGLQHSFIMVAISYLVFTVFLK